GGRAHRDRERRAHRHGRPRRRRAPRLDLVGAPAAGPLRRRGRRLAMEFGFTPEEEAFRAEVRAFLREHPPETFPEGGMDAGYGSGAHSHAFMRALGARGWLTLGWPREQGGQERSLMHRLILMEELASAGAPFGPLAGCDQTAEAIIRWGSPRL